MAENVRQLNIVPKYNRQAVEFLKELLMDAESGEVVEVVCISKRKDGTYDTCWTGCEDLLTLIGHMERVKQLTLRRMDT